MSTATRVSAYAGSRKPMVHVAGPLFVPPSSPTQHTHTQRMPHRDKMARYVSVTYEQAEYGENHDLGCKCCRMRTVSNTDPILRRPYPPLAPHNPLSSIVHLRRPAAFQTSPILSKTSTDYVKGADLPIPSDLDIDEIAEEAQIFRVSIFRDWTRLNAILKRFELTIQKRWM